ncbi:hypothetical protein [Methanococcoides burtonii]|uniref:Uncharacterized protein n=1 Tax=Methanococcoides burtonii (strain DSM 6242 / NBRC 107633 / OCM 468 / ACE-M) TaxID=259564 RepID=Q12XU8_METBU|nr:hypothetical protein [Methanococcoides burtonii]ABE51728.1 Hypothetical protein Mbur_0769 [Methanococcoides burtonii DSM 6242]
MNEVRTELLLSKGIGSVLFLDETDRKKIIELEMEDVQKGLILCGKKSNVGMHQVLGCDMMIGFLTNNEFQWPKHNIKLMHGGRLIGEDVSDPVELKGYQDDPKYCVLGNIVILYEEFLKVKSSTDPIDMVINAHPFPSIEVVYGISGAVIASPSRASDEYIRSLSQDDYSVHIGSFLLGFNLKTLEYTSSLVTASLKGSVY